MPLSINSLRHRFSICSQKGTCSSNARTQAPHRGSWPHASLDGVVHDVGRRALALLRRGAAVDRRDRLADVLRLRREGDVLGGLRLPAIPAGPRAVHLRTCPNPVTAWRGMTG